MRRFRRLFLLLSYPQHRSSAPKFKAFQGGAGPTAPADDQRVNNDVAVATSKTTYRNARRHISRRRHCSSALSSHLHVYQGLSAQEPSSTDDNCKSSRIVPERIPYKQGISFGTYNVEGLLTKGRREILESWAISKHLDLVALQETHVNSISWESRPPYRYYFSTSSTAKSQHF